MEDKGGYDFLREIKEGYVKDKIYVSIMVAIWSWMNMMLRPQNQKQRVLFSRIFSFQFEESAVLIAINPFKTVHELYTSEIIKQYGEHSIGALPAHVSLG